MNTTTQLGRNLIAQPTETEIARLAEAYALGEVLSDWHPAFTYESITNRLRLAENNRESIEEHFGEDIAVCVAFEYCEPGDLIAELTNYRTTFIAFATDLLN